jgi:predicted adenine nucleotide alpha hydrolase (AANH) superfamily ATPase
MSESSLIFPFDGEKNLLLHSCCAPCSGDIMQSLLNCEINFTIFFYNPNIHPVQEYEIRKEENKRFAEKLGILFVDADYDTTQWFAKTKGMEFEAERGRRCSVCFEMRLERTALYAHENGFKVFATSMGISRWKDMAQVNQAGERAAQSYPELTYWAQNWRKKGGSQRMVTFAKQAHFYQQEYCGCVHSLREVNQRRKAQGREIIIPGGK